MYAKIFISVKVLIDMNDTNFVLLFYNGLK